MFISKPTVDDVRVGVSLVFQNSLTQSPSLYQNYCLTTQSATPSNIYPMLDAVPGLRKWLGPRLIRNIVEQNTEIVNEDYEHTVQVGVNEIEDDNIGTLNARFALAARAASTWRDQLAVAALQTGTSTLICHDGLPLFNANHPLNPAGVQSNSIVAASGPDSVGWDTVRSAMTSYTAADGQPLGIMPDLVIVPPQLELKAKTTFTTAYGASGSTNVQQNEARVIVEPRLANEPTIWYVADTKKVIQGLIFQERKAPTLTELNAASDPNVFLYNQYVWGIHARGAAGPGYWPLIARIRPA